MSVNVPPGFYDTGRRRAVVRTARVSVGQASTAIIDNEPERLSVVIKNAGSADVYIGNATQDLLNDGHVLSSGDAIYIGSSVDLFAYASSGTQVLSLIAEYVR